MAIFYHVTRFLSNPVANKKLKIVEKFENPVLTTLKICGMLFHSRDEIG
jgi:hypothetical protein